MPLPALYLLTHPNEACATQPLNPNGGMIRLPQQLHSQLENAPGSSPANHTKGRGIDVRVRLRKLCVVKSIEGFEAKLISKSLRDRDILKQRQIPIVDARRA